MTAREELLNELTIIIQRSLTSKDIVDNIADWVEHKFETMDLIKDGVCLICGSRSS